MLRDLNAGICCTADKEQEKQNSAYLNGDPNDSINVGVKVIKLSVTETVSKVYPKGFKDYRFWL